MKEQSNNTTRNVWVIINNKKYTLSQALGIGVGKRELQAISAIQNDIEYHGLSQKRINEMLISAPLVKHNYNYPNNLTI